MGPRLSENKVGGNCTGARSSDNNNFTHYNSAAAAVIAQYSASVEERAAVRCFVELREIGLAQRKIRKALVEVQSLGLLAQFALEKPCNVRGVSARSRILRDLMPLRQRSSRWTSL